MKELKALARERGIRGHSKLRKAELIEALGGTEPQPQPSSRRRPPSPSPTLISSLPRPRPRSRRRPPSPPPLTNILDEPIPEINVSILKPSHAPRNSHVLAGRVAAPVQQQINKFADWILSYLSEPIKTTVNRRVDRLKRKVNRIFRRMERLTPKERQTALKGYLKTYRVYGQRGCDPQTFIPNIKPRVLDLIYRQKKPIKTKFILTCKFIKENPANGQLDENSGYFHTNVEVVTAATGFSDLFTVMAGLLVEKLGQFQKNGSGWQFDQVEYLDIHIDPYKPLYGSSYVPLPPVLASKKAIINVKNEKDHECFKWAVNSAVCPKEKDPQRLTEQMRENYENFDWTGIEFPVSLKQVDLFEKQYHYAINGYERYAYPLRISKKREAPLLNLLLISSGETSHNCWIKNMSRLLRLEVSKHKSRAHFCPRCLNHFQSKETLNKHLVYCSMNEEVKIEMPVDRDGNPQHISFRNFKRKMRVPFVVYTDFESYTEKIATFLQMRVEASRSNTRSTGHLASLIY